MRLQRTGAALVLAAGLAILAGCVGENQAATAAADKPIKKGGDGRYGQYSTAANTWWSAGPDHAAGPDAPECQDDSKAACWAWGQVSGNVAVNSNRILVGITGDTNLGAGASCRRKNYIVGVNGNGEQVENWTQWDTMVAFPHQLYVSPYDPEQNIWIVDRGGGCDGKNIHEQVFKFSNDGKQVLVRMYDPNPRQSDAEVLANQPPGPFDFGQASTLAFLPNGDILLGDGYQNGRVARYNSKGEFISDFGSPGKGPGQFDLVHGIAVGKDHKIYVSDRDNNRIQVFQEDGTLIEEWPDIQGPTGIYIDDREHVWVLSTTLNGVAEYTIDGQLMQHFGAYCCTRGGFQGGLSRPHQMSRDELGNIYISNYDPGPDVGQLGGYVTKYTPLPDADPDLIVGPPLKLTN
jgi:hypothetical protein